jgi:hypothetical protein
MGPTEASKLPREIEQMVRLKNLMLSFFSKSSGRSALYAGHFSFPLGACRFSSPSSIAFLPDSDYLADHQNG